jgi:light-regulated signal transduction histidine kinase (bacteriophytochrome)
MPVVHAARGPMQQLFKNLIDNALRYHDEGNKPIVKIWSEESETHWKFYVQDNGIGIDSAYL